MTNEELADALDHCPCDEELELESYHDEAAARLRANDGERKPLPKWCGIEVRTSNALPRGYIWLHSETEAGSLKKDDLDALLILHNPKEHKNDGME